ncbi:uncharacterized protein [Macrobrachium rosenbergii]|uniref:uncharacterized protein n=1 Tax=Macrobrachium rosenbergii TaxID=79674 RepID=UPI0034D5EC31
MMETQQYGDRVGGNVLGKASGKKPPDDKETWWWNDEVKEVMTAKKDSKKFWEKYGQQEDKERHSTKGMRNKKNVKKALKKMKNGEAIGPDGIPAEVWKSLGEKGIDMLWDLAQKICSQEKIPKECRESFIVPIYKEKDDIQDCANYTGIKLMSHTMKI